MSSQPEHPALNDISSTLSGKQAQEGRVPTAKADTSSQKRPPHETRGAAYMLSPSKATAGALYSSTPHSGNTQRCPAGPATAQSPSSGGSFCRSATARSEHRGAAHFKRGEHTDQQHVTPVYRAQPAEAGYGTPCAAGGGRIQHAVRSRRRPDTARRAQPAQAGYSTPCASG
jgi:hypothetical protein